MILKIGKNFIRDLLYDKASAPVDMSHLAVGTGTTPVTSDDTKLETEIPLVDGGRGAFYSEKKPADRKWRVERRLAVGDCNGYTLTELGIFNNAAFEAGDDYDRQVFSGIAKTASFSLRIQVETEVEL